MGEVGYCSCVVGLVWWCFVCLTTTCSDTEECLL